MITALCRPAARPDTQRGEQTPANIESRENTEREGITDTTTIRPFYQGAVNYREKVYYDRFYRRTLLCVPQGTQRGRKKQYLQIGLKPHERAGEKLQIMIFVARSLYQVTVDLNLDCNPNSREALCIHNH